MSKYIQSISKALISIFVICLLTGFSHSLYSLATQKEAPASCCPVSTACHAEPTQSNTLSNGLCAIEKLISKGEQDKKIAAPVLIVFQVDTLIEPTALHHITEAQMSLCFEKHIPHDPPLYVVHYPINAPPIS